MGKERKPEDQRDESSPSDNGPDLGRRRFTKLAAYVPPAIIGTLFISRNAAAQSCGPTTCNPASGCVPGDPCGPTNCSPRA